MFSNSALFSSSITSWLVVTSKGGNWDLAFSLWLMKPKNVFLLGENMIAFSFPKYKLKNYFLQTIQRSLHCSLIEVSALVCLYRRFFKCCKFLKYLGKCGFFDSMKMYKIFDWLINKVSKPWVDIIDVFGRIENINPVNNW